MTLALTRKRSARALRLHHEARRLRDCHLTVMSGLRSTLGLSRTMFTARPIVLSLSTLLVPLLASLYLLTENGARRFETGPRYQNA